MSQSTKIGTKIRRRHFLSAAFSSLVVTLAIASCTPQKQTTTNPGTAPSATTAATSQPREKVKVGVWAVTSKDVLKYVQGNLAAQQGLDIEIVKFNDWIQPNTALKDGAIDANYFQHRPFMTNAAKELKLDLVMLSPGILTPMGIYSKKYKSLTEVPNNATVAIYKDSANGDRCLRVLATNGLIKLKDSVGEGLASIKDIAENPKNLQFKELDGPTIVRGIEDVDLGVFSAGLRLQAKLDLPPIVEESASEKRYAVGLVTIRGKENDPKLQKLNQLVTDPKIKDFLKEKYKGTVVAVF